MDIDYAQLMVIKDLPELLLNTFNCARHVVHEIVEQVTGAGLEGDPVYPVNATTPAAVKLEGTQNAGETHLAPEMQLDIAMDPDRANPGTVRAHEETNIYPAIIQRTIATVNETTVRKMHAAKASTAPKRLLRVAKSTEKSFVELSDCIRI